jgi:hypothetical protein
MRANCLNRGLAVLATAALVFGTGWREARAGERMIVHEWGTFTSLQDDDGMEMTGINIDDEPVPDFVHNLSPYLLNSSSLSPDWQYRQKGTPRQHPMVAMRLETPVIYFYPPPSALEPVEVDVNVRFRGGWLTEFYPRAKVDGLGVKNGAFQFGELTPQTIAGLRWERVRVGVEGPFPETDEHVWLAPRKVASAPITMPSGESEKYLFYRGVGNLRAPLRVVTDRQQDQLSVAANFDEVLSNGQYADISALWLVHIKADGTTAFRRLDPIRVSADPKQEVARFGRSFAPSEFAPRNLDRLRDDMLGELVRDGLFSDEAAALLSTWERAYFKSPGLRLFFLVPRSWTDYYLPLELSVRSDVERVMVGRIELVTDEQRALLARLASMTIASAKWVDNIPKSEAREKFFAGRSNFGDLGVSIPPDFQAYLALGRFRNALVAAEERQRPTPSLTRFIDQYGLHPYRWPSQVEKRAETGPAPRVGQARGAEQDELPADAAAAAR